MSISNRAFRFFFRSAMLWRKRRHPSPEQLDRMIDRITGLGTSVENTFQKEVIGNVPCWISGPTDQVKFLIVFIHGGGFALCNIHSHYRFIRWLTEKTGATIVFPEYSKTPTHCYPHQRHECIDVWNASLEKFKPQKTALMGDSAGGNLVASLLVKPEGLHQLPNKVIMMSPWLDLSHEPLRAAGLIEDDVFTLREVEDYATMYVGEHDPKIPELSPLWGDYPSHIPTMISYTENELFAPLIEQFFYKQASPRIEVIRREDMFHVWPLFVGFIPEAYEDGMKMVDFLLRD